MFIPDQFFSISDLRVEKASDPGSATLAGRKEWMRIAMRKIPMDNFGKRTHYGRCSQRYGVYDQTPVNAQK
jgi:hypothetical protein